MTTDSSAEAALVTGANKELAYLERFGQPLLPFQRERREGYQYKKQPPSDHVENLNRHLLIASSLIPRSPPLSHFHIRHPDIQPSNIFVTRSPDSSLRIVGLIDWQHTSILPTFLLAGIPQRIQNYDDPVTQALTKPSLPENMDELNEVQQSQERELYRRRLVHYHYVENTAIYNKLHWAALAEPLSILRRRLFTHSSAPWEGETIALKIALIEAMQNWDILAGEDKPCPIVFDAEDVRETMKLDKVLTEMGEAIEMCRKYLGFGEDGWVPAGHYEEAMALCKKMKETALAQELSEKERAEVVEHWPFDDMDEEQYM
jgi:hypothetical protein